MKSSYSIGTHASAPLRYRRILLTGAGGFVGRRLLKQLVTRIEPDCRIFSGGRSAESQDGSGAVVEIALDLCDPASVMRAVEVARPDLILHLAAQSSAAQTGVDPARTWRVNLGGTLALAEAVAALVPKATVLFTSSSEVYGRAFNRGVATEETCPEPESAYARSKFAAEQMLLNVLPGEATLLIARPSNHSGAGQDERFVLPSFAAQIASRQPALKVGNLAAERDFLHVDDVVDAYLALLTTATGGGSRSLFNISSGTTVGIGTLLQRMIGLSGRPIAVEIDPQRLRPSDVPVAAIDSSRIRRETGWMPGRPLDEMLEELLYYSKRLL